MIAILAISSAFLKDRGAQEAGRQAAQRPGPGGMERRWSRGTQEPEPKPEPEPEPKPEPEPGASSYRPHPWGT